MVYVFLIYYGLTFYIPSEFSDGFRYAMRLHEYTLLPFTEFFNMVGGLYSETTVDIVQPLITFIVSRFTVYPGVLFAAFAAFFSYFYLKSINILYNRYKESPGLNAFIFMFFFVFIIPVTNINGFRMWTAAWVFFYGAYHVVLFKDKRFLFIALAASFVHFSFTLANLVLLIYFFAGNRNFIYLPLAVLSFVVPELIAPYIETVGGSLSGVLASRYESYSNEAYILASQGRMENTAWFMQLRVDLILYYLLFALLYIQIRHSSIMKKQSEKNLFSFLLLYLSFVNFGGIVPTVRGRFQITFFLFAALYVMIYILKTNNKRIEFLTWLGLFPMALFTAVSFRQGADTINAWILSPGLGLPLLVPGLSLAELIF